MGRVLVWVVLVGIWTTSVLPTDVGRFWHITDFHFDQNYSSTGDPSKMCWQTSSSSDRSLGTFGDYACDSPVSLINSSLRAMQRFDDKPDFIIWTGDDTAHVSNDYFSLNIVADIISFLTNKIRTSFPTTQVFPVLGNHDAYPKHSFPVDASKLTEEDSIYSLVANVWSDWICPEGLQTFRQSGYYTCPVAMNPKHRVVALNTVLYYSKNPLVNEGMSDPAGQFAWLTGVLNAARANGEKVYLIGHVPTGMFARKVLAEGFNWFYNKFNNDFLGIVTQYSDVIKGQIFGHEHTDSFRVFYDAAGNPINSMFVAPSVTPWNTTLSGIGPNNPGIRSFQYDRTDATLLNYIQYYLNLVKANQGNSDWEQEYDFLAEYGIHDLSPQTLHQLAEDLQTNRSLFEKYFRFNSVSQSGPDGCWDDCQRNHYCAITRQNFDQFRECNNAIQQDVPNAWARLLRHARRMHQN